MVLATQIMNHEITDLLQFMAFFLGRLVKAQQMHEFESLTAEQSMQSGWKVQTNYMESV
jgi:hypothetical protein